MPSSMIFVSMLFLVRSLSLVIPFSHTCNRRTRPPPPHATEAIHHRIRPQHNTTQHPTTTTCKQLTSLIDVSGDQLQQNRGHTSETGGTPSMVGSFRTHRLHKLYKEGSLPAACASAIDPPATRTFRSPMTAISLTGWPAPETMAQFMAAAVLARAETGFDGKGKDLAVGS